MKDTIKSKFIELSDYILAHDIYWVATLVLIVFCALLLIGIIILCFHFTRERTKLPAKILDSVLVLIAIPQMCYFIYWIVLLIQVQKGIIPELPL